MNASANVKIEGRVEVLRLEPGDVIIVTVHENVRIRPDDVTLVKQAIEAEFPGNKVVVVAGIDLSVVKPATA